jgi:5,10-methylenetetrahydromethanopterin reductase
MRFGIRVPPCRPLAEIAETVAEVEQLGFDTAWLPDSQLLWRDAFMAIGASALATSRIQLAVGVSNVATRHASVLASVCRTAQEAAPDRFLLGLGTGFSALAPIGLPPTPRRTLAASVDAIRALLKGEASEFGGVRATLEDPVGACPVYLAASGPRALELAGEVADGVIILSGLGGDRLEASIATARFAASSVNRDPEALDIVLTTFCHITRDPTADLRLFKPIILGMVQLGSVGFLASAGVEIVDPGPLPEVYPDMLHARDWERAMSIADEHVSDEMAQRFVRHACIYGTPEQVRSAVREVAERGVTSLYLQGVGSYEFPLPLARAFAAQVIDGGA